MTQTQWKWNDQSCLKSHVKTSKCHKKVVCYRDEVGYHRNETRNDRREWLGGGLVRSRRMCGATKSAFSLQKMDHLWWKHVWMPLMHFSELSLVLDGRVCGLMRCAVCSRSGNYQFFSFGYIINDCPCTIHGTWSPETELLSLSIRFFVCRVIRKGHRTQPCGSPVLMMVVDVAICGLS